MTTQDACIDVSHAAPYQRAGRVRWSEVATTARLAILRACYRSSPDESYAAHVRAARDAGIATGAYAFLRPGGMQEQIDAFLATVKPGPGALCVADYEDYKGGIPTADEAWAWCSAVKAATGALPLLYSRAGLLDAHVPAGHPLHACLLWLSGYPVVGGAQLPAWDWKPHTLAIPKGWTGDDAVLWQYTSQGRVRGIDGDVDRNVGDLARVFATWPGATS